MKNLAIKGAELYGFRIKQPTLLFTIDPRNTSERLIDYLRKWKSEINNICNTVDGQCLHAIKIVRPHANNCLNWLISAHQSVIPSKKAISVLSGKYKRSDMHKFCCESVCLSDMHKFYCESVCLSDMHKFCSESVCLVTKTSRYRTKIKQRNSVLFSKYLHINVRRMIVVTFAVLLYTD